MMQVAQYIYASSRQGLLHSNAFCVTAGDQCATVAHAAQPLVDIYAEVRPSDVVFAIKTCEKFHSTRLRYMIDTWGKDAPVITYYSHVADPTYPTVDIGVPNTEGGHCAKLEAILRYEL
jgi:UDP-glucose:O-linked fucose beta-1,3-glucosyltransferase